MRCGYGRDEEEPDPDEEKTKGDQLPRNGVKFAICRKTHGDRRRATDYRRRAMNIYRRRTRWPGGNQPKIIVLCK
jgi:hypothetical protein